MDKVGYISAFFMINRKEEKSINGKSTRVQRIYSVKVVNRFELKIPFLISLNIIPELIQWNQYAKYW